MPKKALDVFDGGLHPHVAIEPIPVARQEAAGSPCLRIERRDFIGGQHLADHLVVGLVGVERLNDPIAPPPDVRFAFAHLGSIAVPIAITPDVHPVPAPALAVLRAGQQVVDHALVGVRGGIGQKLPELRGRRRQSDQVQVHARKSTFLAAADSGH